LDPSKKVFEGRKAGEIKGQIAELVSVCGEKPAKTRLFGLLGAHKLPFGTFWPRKNFLSK